MEEKSDARQRWKEMILAEKRHSIPQNWFAAPAVTSREHKHVLYTEPTTSNTSAAIAVL